MPRLKWPGVTLIEVPVNFALNWSMPLAEMPRSLHSYQYADTGG